MLLLLFLLFTKHLIFDFVYQPLWMFLNKGTYGHWGGIAHSGLHAIATLYILTGFCVLTMHVNFNPLWVPTLALAEFIIHYHMDWFKMWYNARKGWGATTHNQFWVLLGIDQWVHSLTYLGLAWGVYFL